jgi:hypothetical protein
MDARAQEGERLAIEALPIFGKPSTAVEPGDGAFDDPAFGDDLEADRGVRSRDDFNLERGQDFLCSKLLSTERGTKVSRTRSALSRCLARPEGRPT